MKCPYCQAELNGEPNDYGRYHKSEYSYKAYWDEYRCECPECGEEFRWFENYVRMGDEVLRMDE